MFNNQRYLTKGVQSEVSIAQKVTHFSEQPEYHREYLIPTGNPITSKVYIIDSDEYSTMLLASEY